MRKQLLNLMILALLISFLGGCAKIANVPDVSQPIITQYVQNSVMIVGGDTIRTGPAKAYEQGSAVVYKLTVSSKQPLTKFTVTTTSDNVSLSSKIIKTVPANAIDSLGNFKANITNVVVYYSYVIHPQVAPQTVATVTFTFQNSSNYVGTSSNTFTVIKQGSTSGKLLTIIDMPALNGILPNGVQGIGIQDNMDLVDGIRSANGVDPSYSKGSFYSISLRTDFPFTADAITNADKVDFAGYLTKYAGTNPVLSNNGFYLVSPSDTVVLTSTYAGATATTIALVGSSGTANITVGGITKTATYVTSTTQTATNFVTANAAAYSAAGLTLTSNAANLVWVAKSPSIGFGHGTIVNTGGTLDGNEVRLPKNDLEAATIRQMSVNLKAAGKALHKVYFQRLDNITGANQVTPAYFDQLTYDNEFNTLLGGVAAANHTNIGPVGLGQVYGFVIDDGRRGLIKTSATLVLNSAGASVAAPQPNAGKFVLFCTIKVQENK